MKTTIDGPDQLSATTNTLVLSYVGIRRAIGISGLVLPIFLGPAGWLVFGIAIQDNMSSYYHTALRDVFVGTLCAIGIFLFCYRGYDWIENWTANVGCGLVICRSVVGERSDDHCGHRSRLAGVFQPAHAPSKIVERWWGPRHEDLHSVFNEIL